MKNPILKYVKSDENSIFGFFDDFEFLSLNYPCSVTHKGEDYPAAVNAFYSERVSTKSGVETLKSTNPYEVKDLTLRMPIPDGWIDNRERIMREVLEEKFSNPELREKLYKTKGKRLINANHWNDDFWGVNENGRGANKMGLILEDIRNSITKVTTEEPKEEIKKFKFGKGKSK